MATTTTTMAPTPASDKSQYFDAPIMHIRTTGDDGPTTAPPPATETGAGAGAGAGGADMPRKRSVLRKLSLKKKDKDAAAASAPNSAEPKSGPTPTAQTADAVLAAHSITQQREAAAAVPSAQPQSQSQPQTQPQPGSAMPEPEQPLSRTYLPSSPTHRAPHETRSILAPSTRSRPLASRKISRSAPGSRRGRSVAGADDTDSDLEDAASDSEFSDEVDAAGYASPVSHNRHRRIQSVSGGTRSRRTSLPPRSGRAPSRAGTAMSRRSRAVSVVSTSGGAFAGGAGTIGPGAVPDASDAAPFRDRAVEAARGLSIKQNKRITKEELTEGKRLSKVLQREGKAERQAVEIATKELGQLQYAQKKAIKEEMRTHTAHAKALKVAHAAELAFLDAQRKLQVAQAGERATQDALDSARAHAERTTARVQEKNREVEMLRAQKAADVREREVKMAALTGRAK